MSREEYPNATKHFKAIVNGREFMVTTTTELKTWGWMHWEVEGVVTEDEARAIQMKFGYHPCGYGFCRFEYPNDSTTSWTCMACCD